MHTHTQTTCTHFCHLQINLFQLKAKETCKETVTKSLKQEIYNSTTQQKTQTHQPRPTLIWANYKQILPQFFGKIISQKKSH